VFNTFCQLGGAVAIALFGTLSSPNPDHIDQGLRLSLGSAAALLLHAALNRLRIRPRAEHAS
jgi:DHA2 family methylenomycin A resistance protein-like MFS transporter